MVEDTHRVLEAACIKRAAVLGLSLGGMVAQEFALRHPERTSALVLCSTTHGGRDATPVSSSAAGGEDLGRDAASPAHRCCCCSISAVSFCCTHAACGRPAETNATAERPRVSRGQ